MRNISVLGGVLGLGMSAAAQAFLGSMQTTQPPVKTGNEKGSRRTAKFSSGKPSSFNIWGHINKYVDYKALEKKVAAARMYNKGLDTETRWCKKSGKAITRVRPNPGTLNLGMNRH